MSPWAVPLGILFFVALDALCAFLRRFDVDHGDGDCIDPSWFQWGTIIADWRDRRRDPRFDRRYVVIRLPSYSWQPNHNYPPNIHGDWTRWHWTQRCLFYLQ